MHGPLSSRRLRRTLWRECGAAALRADALGADARRRLRGALLRRELDVAELEPLPEASSVEVEPSEPAETATHWIEIALVGEDDQPIPSEPFEIELPNGRVVRGRLDARGTARVDGIDEAGTCKVTFPRLDQDAWTTR